MKLNVLSTGVIASALLAAAAVGAANAHHAPMHGKYGKAPYGMMHHPYAQYGQQQKPRFGIAIAAIPQAELDKLSLEYGVRIEHVTPGSVAERTGIKPGDLVTGIDDRPVYSPQRAQYLIKQAADKMTVSLMRDGENLKLQGEFPEPKTMAAGGKAYLGIRMQAMTDDLKEAFGAEGDRGVLISQVEKGSAAHQAGLEAGDVVTRIGDKAVTSVRDVLAAMAGYAAGDEVSVDVLRDRELQSVAVELGSKPTVAWQHPELRQGWKGHGQYGGHHHPHGSMKGKGCYRPGYGSRHS